MENQQEQMAQSRPVVYRSVVPRLRVGFKKPRGHRDGKPIPFPSQQFIDGRLVVDPERYEHWEPQEFNELIRLLDTHPKNRAKGGKEFWQESQDDRDLLEVATGKIVARPPYGGITKQAEKILIHLQSASKRFAPAEQPVIYAKLCEIMDLFNVKGLSKPDETFSPVRLRARIVEFLGVLEDNNLWKHDDDSQGQANPGQS